MPTKRIEDYTPPDAGQWTVVVGPFRRFPTCLACRSSRRSALSWSKAGYTDQLCDEHLEEARAARHGKRAS